MMDLTALRHCLGQFATGVTVVTCSDAGGHPCGITANSFSSVSLDPPLVLWNIAKVSNSLEAFTQAEHFVINVLSDEHEALSRHFAKSDHTLFDDIDYLQTGEGVPVLRHTLARLDCLKHAIHDCGDHFIIIGRITNFHVEDRQPLLFYGGRYRKLNSSER